MDLRILGYEQVVHSGMGDMEWWENGERKSPREADENGEKREEMKRMKAIPEEDVVLLGEAIVLFSCDKGRYTQVRLGAERQEKV